jgi:CRP/FNR family cyclic AMP-dependent transcriptional regulator
VPLFSELGKKDLERLVVEMRERTFPAGKTITEEGADGLGFFVIESGEAEVTVEGETRRTLGPGDHFGEVALLTGTPRTATIVAKTDLGCMGLAAWQFTPLVQGDATIAWKLLQGLAKMV